MSRNEVAARAAKELWDVPSARKELARTWPTDHTPEDEWSRFLPFAADVAGLFKANVRTVVDIVRRHLPEGLTGQLSPEQVQIFPPAVPR
jgi:hypothetical protein